MPKETILTFVKDILTNVLDVLKDEDYQRRVWFKHEGPEVSTYIDLTGHFLGRCEAIFKIPQHEEYLGIENYNLLKKLYDQIVYHVDATENNIDPESLQEDMLLNDPRWHDIQTLAGEVELKLIEFVKRKENEQSKNTK